MQTTKECDELKIHRFECKNNHIFFMPLKLPQGVAVFAETIGRVKCPLCDCGSNEISMNANEFVVR